MLTATSLVRDLIWRGGIHYPGLRLAILYGCKDGIEARCGCAVSVLQNRPVGVLVSRVDSREYTSVEVKAVHARTGACAFNKTDVLT